MKTKGYWFYKKNCYDGRYGPYEAKRVEKAWADFVRDRFSFFGYEPLWKEMRDEWEYIKL